MPRLINARSVRAIVLEEDPRGNIARALIRTTWARVQGHGVPRRLHAKGAPEVSYLGAYADGVQPRFTSQVGSRSAIVKDPNASDISNSLTAPGSAAARIFANRLRNGTGL